MLQNLEHNHSMRTNSPARHEPRNMEALACEGGPPVRTAPLPPWPVFDDEEIAAVEAVLRSGGVNYWTGNEVRSFEEEFAQAVGCRHAVALANGSVALELALHSLGIGPGDEVIVTARSFIASAACCVLRGAEPVFADVDPISQNIGAESIRAALGPRSRAIIAVHLAGWPCDMDPILRLAEEFGLAVIEDCAQAHGATYKGRPVGSLGHAATFSFCQDKILTTGGEGGMLTTNEESIWRRAWSYKDHGKDWEAVRCQDSGAVFKWLHRWIGTNWRMTEMQAAIGRVVLRRLPVWLRARRRNAALLNDRLGRFDALRIAVPPSHVSHSCYKYYAFLRPERLGSGWTRDRVVSALRSEGTPCGSGICPEIYRERAFADAGFGPIQRLPIARELGETSLMLPVHPTLAEADVLDMCRAMEKVLRHATDGSSGQRLRAA
jgi:dTDP-4-amino-4,6-dideoxygalactose transaminase